MKLIAGKPEYTEIDRTIMYFRTLGYSKHKTRKLLRISSRQFTRTDGSFGKFNAGARHRKGMHTLFKDEKTLTTQLKRSIVDLVLHHGISVEELNTDLTEVLDMVKFATNRRNK